MSEKTTGLLGVTVKLNTDFEDAVQRVTQALKAEGFGVLTEIDVQSTLKKKIDVDFRPYRILGACNPPLAYQALNTAPEVGLLLPCNVVVDQVEDGVVAVSFIDPIAMLGVLSYPQLEAVANDARLRLNRVADALLG